MDHCVRYELNDYNRGIGDDDLLADLRAVAGRVDSGLSQPCYRSNGGRFHPSTFARR